MLSPVGFEIKQHKLNKAGVQEAKRASDIGAAVKALASLCF